jgi:hypothetical protein
MRRGKDYRLMQALRQLAARPVTWEPPAGERASNVRKLFGRGRVRWADADQLAMVEKGARQVVEEQEGQLPAMPFEPVYFQAETTLMDWLLSDLSEDECQKLFEEQAARGADARDTLRPLTNEELGLDEPVYSTGWRRVPDEVFLQYGQLEDRRPA